MLSKVYVLMGDTSPIIMYYCNSPLSYIFVKSQVVSRTQKADFDLQPTSVIYIRCKANVINDYWRTPYTPYLSISVQIRENTAQNNSEYEHFLRSDCKPKS